MIRTILSLMVVVLCLLIFGVGSKVFYQTSPGQRWHPRRSPANVEFKGDQVCVECHKKQVVTQSQSAMGMAMEPVANRSEERRVGKECRCRWWRDYLKQKRGE